MKHLQKLFLLTFFVFISIYQMNTVTQADETTPVKILFIGNSSTYYNLSLIHISEPTRRP